VTASVGYFTGTVQDIAAVAVIVFSAAAAVLLFARYKPRLVVRVTPRWIDGSDLLVLRLEVENSSSARSSRPEVRLQVLKPTPPAAGASLSEYIPFEEDEWKKRQYPGGWQDPMPVFERTTDRVYPGEVMAVERLMNFVGIDKETVLHIGLEVRLRRNKLLARVRQDPWRHSQTTTCFVPCGSAAPL